MRSHWVLGVAALLLSQGALAADVESELASLREAVSLLQRENAEMREELGRLSDASRPPEAAPSPIEDDADSAAPRLVLNGFADLNAGVSFHDPDGTWLTHRARLRAG